MWAFGGDFFWSLCKVPTRVQSLPKRVKEVSGGSSHAAFLIEGGDVWTCGSLLRDHILHPIKLEALPMIESIASGAAHLILLDADGNVWAVGLHYRS